MQLILGQVWILALSLSSVTHFRIDFLPDLIIQMRLFELLELIWVS